MASTSRRPAAEPHLSARVLSFRDAALRGWQGRALQESSVGGGIQPIGCNSGGQLGRPYSGNSLSAAPEATHRLTRETLRRPTTAMWMLHVVAIVGFEGDEMALEGEWSAEDASRELQNVGEGLWGRGFGSGGAGNRGGGNVCKRRCLLHWTALAFAQVAAASRPVRACRRTPCWPQPLPPLRAGTICWYYPA